MWGEAGGGGGRKGRVGDSSQAPGALGRVFLPDGPSYVPLHVCTHTDVPDTTGTWTRTRVCGQLGSAGPWGPWGWGPGRGLGAAGGSLTSGPQAVGWGWGCRSQTPTGQRGAPAASGQGSTGAAGEAGAGTWPWEHLPPPGAPGFGPAPWRPLVAMLPPQCQPLWAWAGPAPLWQVPSLRAPL